MYNVCLCANVYVYVCVCVFRWVCLCTEGRIVMFDLDREIYQHTKFDKPVAWTDMMLHAKDLEIIHAYPQILETSNTTQYNEV